MRKTPTPIAVVLVGILGSLSPAPCQRPAQKSEPAKQASLREKAQQMPLQSLVRVKGSDGRTCEGRLKEVTNQGIALQIVNDKGIENRHILFEQLVSLTAGIVPEELSKLYPRKGLFLVPEGSLVELQLSDKESMKGVVEEYSDNAFVFRIRNEKLAFERKTILFSQVKYFAVKAWANPSVISDPEAFKLLGNPAGSDTNSTQLQDGTPVIVRLRHTISTVDALVGDAVDFEIAQEVRAGGQVVLRGNGVAWGRIVQLVPKRRVGRGSKLQVEIAGARDAAGGTLSLKATKEAARGGRMSSMAGAFFATGLFNAAMPVIIPMLFIRGADTAVPQGTLMVAYVNGDMQIP